MSESPSIQAKVNVKSILSLTFSICALFIWLLGVPAIILGAMAKGEIDKSKGEQNGVIMAISGIVLGAVFGLAGMVRAIDLLESWGY
jgi:hypothetical protein